MCLIIILNMVTSKSLENIRTTIQGLIASPSKSIVKKIIKVYKDEARDCERINDWIERVGWPRFFELTELPFTKYHIDNWRGGRKTLNSSAYIRF